MEFLRDAAARGTGAAACGAAACGAARAAGAVTGACTGGRGGICGVGWGPNGPEGAAVDVGIGRTPAEEPAPPAPVTAVGAAFGAGGTTAGASTVAGVDATAAGEVVGAEGTAVAAGAGTDATMPTARLEAGAGDGAGSSTAAAVAATASLLPDSTESSRAWLSMDAMDSLRSRGAATGANALNSNTAMEEPVGHTQSRHVRGKFARETT